MGMYISKNAQKILEYAVTEGPVRMLLGLPQKSEQEITGYFGKVTPQKRYMLKKKIVDLENAKLITLGPETIKLTKRGKKLLEQYRHKRIEILPSKWDGIWHLVTYDIPNVKNRERDAFRRQLKEWGFYQIQKSLWVIPYECKEEVAIIAQDYGIGFHVIYLTATDLPMAAKLKKYFNL